MLPPALSSHNGINEYRPEQFVNCHLRIPVALELSTLVSGTHICGCYTTCGNEINSVVTSEEDESLLGLGTTGGYVRFECRQQNTATIFGSL
jgi:hypothetical protein